MKKSSKEKETFIFKMTRQQILSYLKQDCPQELFKKADNTCVEICENQVHLRAIIEFSNYCCCNCLYCGLRKDNLKLKRYRMSLDEIFDTAKKAVLAGYKTVVLQSGEDKGYPISDLCGLIKKIKQELGCAITLSIGEKTYEEYKLLKQAGADRYLLKFETSSKKLYEKLKPGSFLEKRLNCLKQLKDLGYQTGSGSLIGLPGQDIAEDLLLIEKLDLDMISVSPFIPNPQTPLNNTLKGKAKDVLKAVALTRIITKYPHIPATTALKTVDFKSWKQALNSGANVIMVNMTPAPYIRYYEIYPGISAVDDDFRNNKKQAEDIIRSLGKITAKSYGHSLKNIKENHGV